MTNPCTFNKEIHCPLLRNNNDCSCRECANSTPSPTQTAYPLELTENILLSMLDTLDDILLHLQKEDK